MIILGLFDFKSKAEKYSEILTHHYQPIYDINKSNIIGYEALLRSNIDKISPLKIFEDASRLEVFYDLDKLSIKKAVEKYTDIDGILFLNIFPTTILLDDFIEWWDINIPEDLSIVLEISEKEDVVDWNEFKIRIQKLRDRGIRIALDDMGVGFSNLYRIIELSPEFIKFDRFFCENLPTDIVKQNIIKKFKNIWMDSTKFILQGVEDEETLITAKTLGLVYYQGYYISKPFPIEELKNKIKKRNKNFQCQYRVDNRKGDLNIVFQKVIVEINKKERRFFNIQFEKPLCAVMKIVEVNGIKIENNKINICVFNIRPDGLTFKSKYDFPVSGDYVLEISAMFLGKEIKQKGKIIEKNADETSGNIYEVKLIENESQISENVHLLNSFQLLLKKNEVLENTNFCPYADCGKCLDI